MNLECILLFMFIQTHRKRLGRWKTKSVSLSKPTRGQFYRKLQIYRKSPSMRALLCHLSSLSARGLITCYSTCQLLPTVVFYCFQFFLFSLSGSQEEDGSAVTKWNISSVSRNARKVVHLRQITRLRFGASRGDHPQYCASSSVTATDCVWHRVTNCAMNLHASFSCCLQS